MDFGVQTVSLNKEADLCVQLIETGIDVWQAQR